MSLHLDWATHQSAKYAVEHWHYSKCMPAGKLVKIGVWEDKQFIGVVMFGLGANNNMGKSYGLEIIQAGELVRVALKNHKTPVSKIISISLKMLNKKCPKLRLIVSYADSNQGHIGSIYQAGNWIYDGFNEERKLKIKNKIIHNRTLSSNYGTCSLQKLKKLFPDISRVKTKKKYRYLMPLNKQMRKQIEPLSKPYPKRMPLGDSRRPAEDGGANPTHTLQTNGE